MGGMLDSGNEVAEAWGGLPETTSVEFEGPLRGVLLDGFEGGAGCGCVVGFLLFGLGLAWGGHIEGLGAEWSGVDCVIGM